MKKMKKYGNYTLGYITKGTFSKWEFKCNLNHTFSFCLIYTLSLKSFGN